MKTWLGKFKSITLLGLLTIVLAGCGKENLTALSPKGGSADTSLYLIILTTIVMSLVFLAVVIPFIIVLFRFRKKKGDAEFIPEQVEGNQKLETIWRSEEHTSELQSRGHLVCRLLLEKKKQVKTTS